jgi:hypothetical protein
MKYEAYLESRPAAWNTWHYVVRITDFNCEQKVVYFSESSPGKPPVDIKEGVKGYIIYKKISSTCILAFWESQNVNNVEKQTNGANE